MRRWRVGVALAALGLLALDQVAGLADPAPTGSGRPEWQVGDWWLLQGRERAGFVRMSDPPWVESPVYRMEVTAERPCAQARCLVVEVRAFANAAAARRGGRSERALAELWYRRPDLELVAAEARVAGREPLKGRESAAYLPFPVVVPDLGLLHGLAASWADPRGRHHPAVTVPLAAGAQTWSGGAPWWVAWNGADRELIMVDASWWRDGRRRPDFVATAARRAEGARLGPSGQLPLARERAGPGQNGRSPGTGGSRLDETSARPAEEAPRPAPGGALPLLLIDQAHDNFFRVATGGEAQGAGYRRFAEVARADGWRVASQTRPWTAGALENARVVVVPLPQRAYADEEIDALRRFVEAGGGLLLALEGGAADAAWNAPSQVLAGAFRFALADQPVQDPHGGVLGREAIAAEPAPGHPLGRGVDRVHAFRAFAVEGGQPLLLTPTRAEPGGAAILAAREIGRGRVAVAGDANLFDDAFGLAGHAGNQGAVGNLLDWLGRRHAAELRYAVRGPTRAGGRVSVTLAAGRIQGDHRGTRVIRLRGDADGRFSALLYLSLIEAHPPRVRVDKLIVDAPEYAVWPVGEERALDDRPVRIPFAVEGGNRRMEVEIERLPPPSPQEEHP